MDITDSLEVVVVVDDDVDKDENDDDELKVNGQRMH